MMAAPAPKRPRVDAPLAIRASTAGSKGRKHTMEDVTVLVDDLMAIDAPAPAEGSGHAGAHRAWPFYAILDGHGGCDVAEAAAARLPSLLAEKLRDVPSGASAATKDAIRRAFVACDAEMLARCKELGWVDGCCVIGVLIDSAARRAYVANLGDSRAFAAVSTGGGGAGGGDAGSGSGGGGAGGSAGGSAGSSTGLKAVALSKDHSPLEPAERKRIEGAGGFVERGRVCASLEVSRSLGDARLKSSGLSATPDVTSFALDQRAQRFLLLGCDGLWRVFSGVQAVHWLAERLPAMDADRARLDALFADATATSALTKEALAAASRERDGASEAALLRAMVHEAVHARNAKDNITAILVRLWDE